MNRRRYKSDPEKLLEQGKKIMMNSNSTDSKYKFRVFSVNLVLSGMSAAEVAQKAGVTRSTVSDWVKTADEQGFDALKTVKPTGRRPKLSEAQREEIDAILQKNPNDYGYKVWDGPSLSDLIKNRPPRKLTCTGRRKILAIGQDDDDGGLAPSQEEDDAYR